MKNFHCTLCINQFKQSEKISRYFERHHCRVFRKMKDPLNNLGFVVKNTINRMQTQRKNPTLSMKLYNEVHPDLSVRLWFTVRLSDSLTFFECCLCLADCIHVCCVYSFNDLIDLIVSVLYVYLTICLSLILSAFKTLSVHLLVPIFVYVALC